MGEGTQALTGVSADLTAWHTDTLMNEGRHQHTWRVTAWWRSVPFVDGRVKQEALRGLLAVWEGTDLPPELWSGEAIASAVMALLPECIGCDVSRPTEGFYAQVRA